MEDRRQERNLVENSATSKLYMSNAIFDANEAKTEVCHFCLKHLKNKIHACKRDAGIPQILLLETPQQRHARLKNKIGIHFGNNFPPLLTCCPPPSIEDEQHETNPKSVVSIVSRDKSIPLKIKAVCNCRRFAQ